MRRKNTLFLSAFILCCTGISVLAGCSASVPKLEPMRVEAPVQTTYTSALEDLNMVLEIYLPPDYPNIYFAIKPVVDATGLSGTGEIPFDITSLVKDALSQVHYKIRHVESYDANDATQLQVELLKLQMQKLQNIKVYQAERPAVDFTIEGRISQFDRNLESTSDKYRAMAAFGGGYVRTDLNASAEKSSRLSRLAVSFSVFNPSGVNLPGKFGASMEVLYAKNGLDLGFAVYGNGLGYGTEATAMHGRHQALQMMTEFSVVQIIGRAINVPYWRIGMSQNIFTRDQLVLNNWRKEYQSKGPLLIAFMQAQCIANGDRSVAVTGQLDNATLAAFDRFASKYGVRNRSYPNFELWCALEENRILSRAAAMNAWGAYAAFKSGVMPSAPVAAPAPPPAPPTPDKKPSPKPEPSPAKKPVVSPASSSGKKPAASSSPVKKHTTPRHTAPAATDDPARALQNLL